METGLEGIWLEEELFVELLLCGLAVYHELSCVEFLAFMLVFFCEGGEAHQLKHFWDRVVGPSALAWVVMQAIQDSNHEYLIIELPFQSMSGHKDSNAFYFEELLNYLPLQFWHSLVNVPDSVLDDMEEVLIGDTLGKAFQHLFVDLLQSFRMRVS